MTAMYFSAGVRLMADEQSLVGLVILANLISIIYFLHIQQENYPDKVLRTKNKQRDVLPGQAEPSPLPSMPCIHLPPDDSSRQIHYISLSY